MDSKQLKLAYYAGQPMSLFEFLDDGVPRFKAPTQDEIIAVEAAKNKYPDMKWFISRFERLRDGPPTHR